MVKLSTNTIKKIKEQILSELYHSSPKAPYTNQLANLIIRDDEFTKKLLMEMEKENLVEQIKKTSKGYQTIRRSRWKLTKNVLKAFESQS